MNLIVGIDFGTSTTVVRYRKEGSDVIHSLKDANGISDVIPTVIFRRDDGSSEYGAQALNLASSGAAGTTVTNFKMDLLDPAKREEAAALTEEFLRYVHSLFREETRGMYPTSTEINISYPAKWDDNMVKIMKEAVVRAGFEGTVKGRKEPEAATRNMLHSHLRELQQRGLLGPGRPLRILLLDMGAGTTDISIFKVSLDHDGIPNITELLSYPSKEEQTLCGGREIDLALRQYLMEYFREKKLPPMEEWFALSHVKNWKDQIVSPNLRSAKPVQLIPAGSTAARVMGRSDIIADFALDRTAFEKASADHWRRLYDLVKSAMAQYKFAGAEEIDFVCLTGGHSAWYTVPRLFSGEGVCGSIGCRGKDPGALDFKRLREDPARMAVLNDALPHESVARGLCLMDERMIYVNTSANNVWARVTLNGEAGQLVQVVSKEDALPVTKNIVKQALIAKNMVFGNLVFNSQIDLYVGETLEKAAHRVLKLKDDHDSILGKFIVFIFTAGFGIKVTYDAKISADITITDEGLLLLDGTFSIDDNVQNFTYDDLTVSQD